jgi:hypothetical protein
MVARAFSQPSRASCAERSRSWLFQLKPSTQPLDGAVPPRSAAARVAAPRGGWPALGTARRRAELPLCQPFERSVLAEARRRHLHELVDLHGLAAAVCPQRQPEGRRALALAVAGVDDHDAAALALGLLVGFLAGRCFDLHVRVLQRVHLRQHHPLPVEFVHRHAVVEHRFQRAVRGLVGAGALVRDAALRHHHHFVGVQGHADFVQHADHGLAVSHQGLHDVQPVGLVRRVEVGQGFVHQQHLGLHRQGAGQQHALALAARQLAERSGAPVPGLGGAQGALDGGAIGLTGGLSQAWCGRRPSMATSHTVKSSPLASFCPSHDSCCARWRLGHSASGRPSRAHCRCAAANRPAP